MTSAFFVAARRTAVAPRNGAFKHVEAWELAAAAIRAVLADSGVPPARVDEVILGNALHGGGNPARLAALGAELPEDVPAMTIDTQCCGGLDAIAIAASRIRSGEAHAVIAGGMESFSRAPVRARRPKHPGETLQIYDQPPFTPWPECDPDMIASAAALAAELDIDRSRQEAFAVESHGKALREGPAAGEIIPVAGLSHDVFARSLTSALCARLPLLAGDPLHGVTAATTAVEADAAAVVLIVSEELAQDFGRAGRALRILDCVRRGGDPDRCGLAPIAAATSALGRCALPPRGLVAAEIMEAFAVQAIACIDGIGLESRCVNRGGGALARGHPIGASGAILAVRLWHEFQARQLDGIGLCAIAAAGGLGTAALFST